MGRLHGLVLIALVSQALPVQGGNGPIFSHGFEDPAPVVTVQWDGGGDGMTWADPVNWVGDQLPQEGNAVVINAPGNPTVIYDASLGTTHLHSLESTESLSLTGGALEFNSLTWSTQALTVGAGASITVFGAFEHSNGTVTGEGTVTVEGLFTWLDGTQSGAGETVANGGMALGGAATVTQTTRTLTLNGSSTWTEGQWNVQHGATINNNAAFDIQADLVLNHVTGTNTTFSNGAAGVLTKSAGMGETAIETNIANDGTVNANSGTLTLGKLNATGDSTGDFVSAPGATLALEGNLMLLAGSSVSGAGAVAVTNGGTVVVQGDFTATGPLSVGGGGLNFDTALVTLSEVTVLAGGTLTATSNLAVTGNFQHNNGTVTGGGIITVGGLFTWLDGTQSGAGETVADGGMALGGAATVTQTTRTLTLNGSSTWTEGQWNVQHGATINTNAAFDIQADLTLNHVTGVTTTFSNGALGILTKSAGAGETVIETDFDNEGTVNVDSGTLALGRNIGSGNSTGDFAVALDATLRLQGAHTLLPASTISGDGGVTLAGGSPNVVAQGSFAFTGPLVLSGGTLNVDTSPLTVLGTFDHTNGTLTGTGQMTVAGLFTWLDGTQSGAGETVANGGMALGGAATVTQTTRTLTLNGSSTWTEGQWNVQHGATINNNAAFDIQADAMLNHVTGVTSTFNNNDALTKSAGASSSQLEVDFTNAGSITVDSGSISFNRTFAQTGAGSLNVGIASASDFDSYAISQAAELGGTLEIILLGGFVPDLTDDPYTIMTFASRTSMFDTENGLIFDPGTARFDITYGGTNVTLTVVADP